MDLFILRHGDANTDSKRITDDSKRALTNIGIKEIENVSKLFTQLDIEIGHIFCSPLKRAKQTSTIISKNQKNAVITEVDELKPEGRPADVCKKIVRQNDASTLIIGHNPLLMDVVNYITNSEKQTTCGFSLKTGGLVKIKATTIESQLRGQIEWLLTPKLIRKIIK